MTELLHRPLTRRAVLMGIAATPLLGAAIPQPVEQEIDKFVTKSKNPAKLKCVLMRAWQHFESGISSANATVEDERKLAVAALATIGNVVDGNLGCFDATFCDDPRTNYCVADCGNLAGQEAQKRVGAGKGKVDPAVLKVAHQAAKRKHGSRICGQGAPGFGC